MSAPTFAYQKSALRSANPIGTSCQNTICPPLSALPECRNFVIYEGDDVLIDVWVVDAQGEPIDLTASGGAIPRAEIRPSPESDLVLAEFDCSIDTTVTNLVHLHLTRAVNVDMPERATYDLQLLWMNLLTTILTGTITWTQEVTRP